MKKVIGLLGGLVCVYMTFGQGYKKRSPEERARYYTDEMVRDIKLDVIQEEKIYLINLVVSNQFDSLYDAQKDKELSKQGAIQIYKKRDQQYRKVLTNEQFLRYDDIQRAKREKRQQEKLEKQQQEKKEASTDSLSENGIKK